MFVPSETQIVEAARVKLSAVPDAGSDLPRLLALLELENDWSDVSSKRFSSILAKHSLINVPSGSNGTTSSTASSSASKKKKKSKPNAAGVPKSFIDTSLSFPPGIRGEYFDSIKGKGLVATRSFAEGEVLFTEDAYIATPPPEALDQVVRGELCGQCFLPVSSAPVQLAIKNCARCKYRFCTSTCHKAAMATHHTLLCSGNVAAKELMGLVEEHKWQSLHSVARSVARLLSTLTPHNNGTSSKRGKDEEDLLETFGDFETVWERLSSFATVSELERRSRNPGWSTEKSTFEPLLSRAHDALRLALDPFHPSRNPSDPSLIGLSLITSTRKSAIKDLFDSATFLKLLGRSNINMEKFGGLYSLHSFLNHSCTPNVSIRHPPERGILSSMKVAALALREIKEGEELVISYIDPKTRLARRQLLLWRDYCFGPCACGKCERELEGVGLKWDASRYGVKGFLESVAKKTGEEEEEGKKGEDASLEEELRASLGF